MGTKLTYLLNTVKTILDNTNEKIIIFHNLIHLLN